MKKTITPILLVLVLNLMIKQIAAQNVGIGTTTPQPTAKLHIDVGNSPTEGFLVSGNYNFMGTIPDLGAGSRMLFYPGKAAFRAGSISGGEWNNTNVGQYSAALGHGTKASGIASFAVGELAEATGANSMAFGKLAAAHAENSIAMGEGVSASGYGSTAMGLFTNAVGEGSNAMGYSTIANGFIAVSMGLYTSARSYGSVAIGKYNEPFAGSNQFAWISTDPLLILGNGTSNITRSNAMVVYKNGNTDINGYTRLGDFIKGEGAPYIKMKKITGTGPATNGNVSVAHGLDATKILSVQIFMAYDPSPVFTKMLPPNYTLIAGCEYQYEINGGNILITNKVGNSANLDHKSFRMLITYDQ